MEKEYGILAIEKNEIQFDGGVESGVKSAIHRLSVNCFLDRSLVLDLRKRELNGYMIHRGMSI